MLKLLRNKLLLINAVSIAAVIAFSFAAVYKSVDAWVYGAAEEALEKAIEGYSPSSPAFSRALPKAEDFYVTVSLIDEGYTPEPSENMVTKTAYLPGVGYLLAECDITSEAELLDRLAAGLCVSGALAVIFVAGISALVANRAIIPVQNSIKRQKQFVTDASHELKTPLAALSATLDILNPEPNQEKWIENIRYEVDRMIRLTASLLNLSGYGGEEDFALVNLSDICSFSALSFEAPAFEKGIEVISNIGDNIKLLGNREQLEQLVAILMDNAIKYNCSGGFVKITLAKCGRHTELSVENTGESIKESDKSEIFERFYRGDKARAGEGFGLGLSIAREIVKTHKGRIFVKSGETTVFSVIL